MKNEEINLYICHSYYHLLIAVIKQLKSDTNSDVILSTIFTNNFLANDTNLIRRLKKSNLFNNVIIVDYSKEEVIKIKHLDSLNRIRLGCKFIRKKEVDFSKYKEIYIFNDGTLMGYILNKLKIRYNFLEDGMDGFKDKYKNFFGSKKFSIKKKIRKFFKVYGIAESPYIKTIEVNDKEDLCINHSKIIEWSKKDVFLNLNSIEKEEILKIFISQYNDLKFFPNSVLILTQPFFESGIFKTEQEKINLYKEIIEQYALEENVIIKKHPAEITDYCRYFKEYKNIKIMSERFPVEIFNLLNIKFKKVITVFSTSINLIENCDEKIELGYDYVNNKME